MKDELTSMRPIVAVVVAPRIVERICSGLLYSPRSMVEWNLQHARLALFHDYRLHCQSEPKTSHKYYNKMSWMIER